ncbi:uncharacterized protein MELLADRAFT_89654 [Melampsora larici-populina 98AG31]|uniref:Tet-like 2OG-Fe(II) oxygenase domain-containing protein n=1 Tax=Melampsora larici-populina (strain 98AG31 / pathotype 3-4-7) TaxID=747676 RepID=F4RU48_MELLP|nr:uncharacterized protein MELLADRAFT_89654 [Melampsora larici-populina 98AG31]EGG04113.1 hypothetical protein MELLADRAFT_89654 [Melampsora larici-populina 98AG31]
MYAMGITGGCSDGTKAAPYCLNSTHGSSTTLIAEDNAQLDLLPRVEQFIGDLFMQQCTLFYGCNLRVSEILNVPSFASTSPFTQPNGVSYGGSLVLTRDQFVNAPHNDKDLTDYAVGLFGTVDRNTGIPIHLPEGVPHRVIIRNSHMRFPQYNAEIVLGQPNIIVLLTWNVRVKHHTLRSTTHFQDGTITDPKTAKVTQIGSLIQVNKKLADQMRDFYVPRDNEEFAVISPKYSSSQEEYSRKQAGARK